jgi:hypothetical protein
MEISNAIQLVRLKRKGALNMQQAVNLMNYKKIGFGKKKNKKQQQCCMIF